jgi:hypothetical protein
MLFNSFAFLLALAAAPAFGQSAAKRKKMPPAEASAALIGADCQLGQGTRLRSFSTEPGTCGGLVGMRRALFVCFVLWPVGAGAAPQWVAETIQDERRLNTICQGSTDPREAEHACALRELYAERLRAAGLCTTRKQVRSLNEVWVRCPGPR